MGRKTKAEYDVLPGQYSVSQIAEKAKLTRQAILYQIKENQLMDGSKNHIYRNVTFFITCQIVIFICSH